MLLLGLAYKANTGDDRESPAVVVVAERLLSMGAQVRVADPHASHDYVHGRVERVAVTAGSGRAALPILLQSRWAGV